MDFRLLRLRFAATRSSRELKMDIFRLIDHERKRGDCYRFLSACFYMPQKELFLGEKLFDNLTLSLKQVCPEAAMSSAIMGKLLLEYSNEELSVDYARLFVGPFELAAPPYGSVYMDKGRTLMGNSTVEVIKMYQEAGLSMAESFKEMPDHITAELEFMYYLIYKEIEAIERSEITEAIDSIGKQMVFTDTFLGQWVPLFCAKIRDNTKNNFYIILSDCLLKFIKRTDLTNNVLKLLEEKQKV